MKKRVVKLNENDIERLVNKIIKEDLPKRELKRKKTQFAKSKFDPYKREEEIMNAFGPYRDDIPPNVVSYIRKNPRKFLKKLTDHYGIDKMLDFIGYEQPTPEVNDELDFDFPIGGGYDTYMGDDMCECGGTSYMKEEDDVEGVEGGEKQDNPVDVEKFLKLADKYLFQRYATLAGKIDTPKEKAMLIAALAKKWGIEASDLARVKSVLNK